MQREPSVLPSALSRLVHGSKGVLPFRQSRVCGLPVPVQCFRYVPSHAQTKKIAPSNLRSCVNIPAQGSLAIPLEGELLVPLATLAAFQRDGQIILCRRATCLGCFLEQTHGLCEAASNANSVNVPVPKGVLRGCMAIARPAAQETSALSPVAFRMGSGGELGGSRIVAIGRHSSHSQALPRANLFHLQCDTNRSPRWGSPYLNSNSTPASATARSSFGPLARR